MRKLNNLKWFSLGIAVCLLTTVLIVPAFASTLSKTAQLVYNEIKITLNGNAVTLTDANGSAVEPFIMDGTIYLPLRAVSSSLGLGVSWDYTTKTAALTTASDIISAPDAIFSTTTETNGLQGRLMYAKGIVQSSAMSNDTNLLFVFTDKGMLTLANPLKLPSWDKIAIGGTYTFTFLYYGNSPAPIIPVGLFLSAK